MKRYQTLLQKRADLLTEADGILVAAEAREDQLLTDDERGRLAAIKSEVATLDVDIDAEESIREAQRRQVAARPADPARVTGVHDRREDDPKRGFADMAEFALAVRGAQAPGGVLDERLRIGAAPSNYHQETGGTAGEGFLVPPAYRDEIWAVAFSEDDLVNMVDFEDTIANVVGLGADETTPWGSTGIQAYWRPEAGQMTASKIDLDARQVRNHELYAFVQATDELLGDAPRLAGRLTDGAGRAIRWKASEAIMHGTGAGQPLGFMSANAGALVTVTKESGQTADTIVDDNVSKMYIRQLNPGRAVWLANLDILPQLIGMTIGNQPVYIKPGGLSDAPYGLLMGRPVIFNDHCPTLGDKGDLQFVDLAGYYAIRRVGGVQAASSIHLFFDYGVTAFRWTFRLGGQPFLSAPISPAKGSATRSHFVTIEARA